MRVKTPARQRGTWAVTAGALTAAFGVATCCALPLALALFGLGTATSLTMIGTWVAPYKGLVSIIAGVGLRLDFSWPIVRAKINAAARHVRHPPIRGL